jgi:site-specific recombinase XerD
VHLPEGVRGVKRKGATYYYWAPYRGTAAATKPIALGKDSSDPEFWAKLRELQGDAGKMEAGTFRKLIADYTASGIWDSHKERTRVHYRHQLSRIETAWGDLPVEGLTVDGIFKLRAGLERTPVAANHLVSVQRTLLGWGLSHGYGTRNPANDVEPIAIRDEQNAKPWTEAAYALVLAKAPEHIRRAVFLGRATGQRRSDLVKLGKKNRRDDGIAFKIGKLRDKEHFIPLTRKQLEEIDSWSCSDTGPWIVSPTGRPMSGDHLQSSLGRFVAKVPELAGVEVKMHGLRAMAACDRKYLGADDAAVGKSIGMSTAMVARYTKHIDQQRVARDVRDGLERAENGIGKSSNGDWKTPSKNAS